MHPSKVLATATWLCRNEMIWERLWNRLVDVGFLHGETLNTSTQHLEKINNISQLPAHEQAPAFAEYQQQADELSSSCGASWMRMRNAVGSCVAAMSLPVYLSYLQRVSDLDGSPRLLLLQRKALAESIASADMPAWLETTPQDLRNPYTLQPMQWDTASSSLIFEGKEKQSQNTNRSSSCRIRLFGNLPLK
ncbi:MAG: hypothetical protein RSD57_04670 [Comamonas sp.]